jgi:galactokinase/galacturonokinase
VILHSKREHLTVIDCRQGEVETIPATGDVSSCEILVVHSGVSRALRRTDFNARVNECGEAARRLLVAAGIGQESAPRLCDVPREAFDSLGAELPRELRLRAEHYFGEMRRVEEGIEAWRAGNLARFAELVTESGASSIHRYESAGENLVTLYDLLRETPGVYGTRFNGGGFGGSCLALVHPEAAGSIAEAIRREYCSAHPEAVDGFSVHPCRSAEGLGLFRVGAT